MGGGGSTEPSAVPGLGRTVLVIDEDPELAVALRDRLDRTFITVCAAHHRAAAEHAARMRPWMVVGAGATVPAGLVRWLAVHPSLVFWRQPPSRRLPAHARLFESFSDLARAVEAALRAQVGGMRLAPGDGLTMPDAEHAANPALEVLVASHPRPVFAPAHSFRHVDRTLAGHAVPVHLERTAAEGARLVDGKR